MNKVELITVVWVMGLPLILVFLLVFLTTKFAQRLFPNQMPRWIVVVIWAGGTLALAIVLFVSPRTADAVITALFPLDNGLLLGLAVLPFILLIGIGTWRLRPFSRRRTLLAYLCAVLLCGIFSLIPAYYFFKMMRFEHAISSALAGEVDPYAKARFEWECRWDCEDKDWIGHLPPVSTVQCTQTLGPTGACCSAAFAGGGGSEIHVFRTGFRRYRVSFYSAPFCPNPAFDPGARAGSPESKELVRCDVDWDS